MKTEKEIWDEIKLDPIVDFPDELRRLKFRVANIEAMLAEGELCTKNKNQV